MHYTIEKLLSGIKSWTDSQYIKLDLTNATDTFIRKCIESPCRFINEQSSNLSLDSGCVYHISPTEDMTIDLVCDDLQDTMKTWVIYYVAKSKITFNDTIIWSHTPTFTANNTYRIDLQKVGDTIYGSVITYGNNK